MCSECCCMLHFPLRRKVGCAKRICISSFLQILRDRPFCATMLPLLCAAAALLPSTPPASSRAAVTPRPDGATPLTGLTGRRTALFSGLAVAAQLSCMGAASAASPENLQGILERAEKGTLRASPVIARARVDRLVGRSDPTSCKQLTSLIEVDNEVLFDILPAFRNYVKSKEQFDKRLVEDMIDDAEIVQKRITKQLNVLADERSARGCP